MTRTIFRYLPVLISIMLTQACSNTRTTAPIPVENRSKATTVEDVEAGEVASSLPDVVKRPDRNEAGDSPETMRQTPVITALLDEAKLAEMNGNHQAESAIIERALRIEPKNPLLWNRLAAARMREGKWQQALNMARRSNSLAAGNYLLQLENWEIILQVKIKVDDRQGITEAEKVIRHLMTIVRFGEG